MKRNIHITVLSSARVALMVPAVLFIILGTTAEGWSQEKKSITLKLGHVAAVDHPGHVAAQEFARRVESRTGGSVKVLVSPDAALGPSPVILKNTMNGVIDMALPNQTAIALYIPKCDLVSLPFMFKDYNEVDAFLDGPFGGWIKEDMDKIGLVYLSCWEWGFRNFSASKSPLREPKDFVGKKFRIPPEVVNQATVEALGGIAKVIQFNDLTLALKQGIVDGQENPIGVIYSNKLYETQKYVTVLNYTYSSMTHVMNKRSFERLSKAHRTILLEESRKAGLAMRNAVRGEEKRQIAEMKKMGVQFFYPDLKKFRTAVAPAIQKMKSNVSEKDYNDFINMVNTSKK